MSTMTESTETCNGYTNRETWAFALWVDNDEGLYSHKQELVESAKVRRDMQDTSDHLYNVKADLADQLKDWATDTLWNPEESGDSDAIRSMRSEVGSLWRVNWDELAGNWLED